MDRLLELTARAEHTHFWFRGFRWFVRPLVEQALAGTPSPRLLDCGCGTGVNMRMLADYGQVFGFDLTWTGLQFAHTRGESRIARASIGQIPFPSAAFDAVTAFDVFAHLPDAVELEAARELYRVLKPGGAMVFNVAALEILRGQHSVLAQELRRYDRVRVRRVFEGAGFTIERLSFCYATLFPIILPVRVAHRMMGEGGEPSSGEFEITVPPAPVNLALTALLAVEAAALRVVNMPFGSSLLCLARKPR